MSPATPTPTGAGEGAVALCHSCRHFGISYDRAAPYLCRVMGFKSKLLPCWEVQQADGRRCMAYAAKPPHAPTPRRLS